MGQEFGAQESIFGIVLASDRRRHPPFWRMMSVLATITPHQANNVGRFKGFKSATLDMVRPEILLQYHHIWSILKSCGEDDDRLCFTQAIDYSLSKFEKQKQWRSPTPSYTNRHEVPMKQRVQDPRKNEWNTSSAEYSAAMIAKCKLTVAAASEMHSIPNLLWMLLGKVPVELQLQIGPKRTFQFRAGASAVPYGMTAALPQVAQLAWVKTRWTCRKWKTDHVNGSEDHRLPAASLRCIYCRHPSFAADDLHVFGAHSRCPSLVKPRTQCDEFKNSINSVIRAPDLFIYSEDCVESRQHKTHARKLEVRPTARLDPDSKEAELEYIATAKLRYFLRSPFIDHNLHDLAGLTDPSETSDWQRIDFVFGDKSRVKASDGIDGPTFHRRLDFSDGLLQSPLALSQSILRQRSVNYLFIGSASNRVDI
ncbi:hypothetical protein B0H19DRAFT_1081265 [Mycena capillaripes]|nr:hypothetical protein B0H19DRAFT_1081265 [Mycena capillaripes]